MKKIISLLLLLLMPCYGLAGNWSLGAGWLYSDNAYLDSKANQTVIPFVSYQSKYFAVYGPIAQLRYPIDPKNTLGLSFQVGMQTYEPKDTRNAQMKLLNERKRLYYLGPYYRYQSEIGDFIANFSVDITNRSKGGYYASLMYSFGFADKSMNYYVRPTLGVKWENKKLIRHFHQVTAAESVASGFSQYTPGNTITPFMMTFAGVKIIEKLYWTNVVNVSYQPGALTKSPMSSGRKFTYSFITGFTFEIGDKEQRFNH